MFMTYANYRYTYVVYNRDLQTLVYCPLGFRGAGLWLVVEESAPASVLHHCF